MPLARPLGLEPKSDGFGDRRATNCTTSAYPGDLSRSILTGRGGDF